MLIQIVRKNCFHKHYQPVSSALLSQSAVASVGVLASLLVVASIVGVLFMGVVDEVEATTSSSYSYIIIHTEIMVNSI